MAISNENQTKSRRRKKPKRKIHVYYYTTPHQTVNRIIYTQENGKRENDLHAAHYLHTKQTNRTAYDDDDDDMRPESRDMRRQHILAFTSGLRRIIN